MSTTSTPYLFVGTPAHLAAVKADVGKVCGDTALSNDGDLLRLVTSCGGISANGDGNLFYQREFLDTIGPKAHLSARASGSAVHLKWGAKDPTPGSGVAYYELQVRSGRARWHTVLARTHTTSLIYRHTHGAQRYTFRLRARDRVDNWGAWVSARASARASARGIR